MIPAYHRSENHLDVRMYSAAQFFTRILVAIACVVGVAGFWGATILFLLALYRHWGGE